MKSIESAHGYPGFSLVELMVALSLLSLVLIGGFTIFNTIEASYVREAGYARSSRAAGLEAERLFLAMHDNSSFSAQVVSSWPQGEEGGGLFSLTPIWDNTSMLNSRGGFACRVSGVDPAVPGFSIPAACLDAAGVTPTALDEMAGEDLPGVLIMDAQEGCILLRMERSGTSMTFDVLNEACLKNSSGEVVHASEIDGSGVIFPRYLIRATDLPGPLKSAFFDHPGSPKDGAGLHFGQNSQGSSPDGSLFAVSSTLPDDNFSRAWVNIHDFGHARSLSLLNPRQLDIFTLKVEALSPASRVATSLAGRDASRRIYRQFNSSAGLERFLHSLHVQSAGNPARLRIHLGAGHTHWVRDLMLEHQ
ncbi:prepilin-type N-terminal cleavage/methylation domain-containing protein [Alphaproteobacteria bacterium LSUCC0684]